MVQNLSSLLTFSAPSLFQVQSGKDSGLRRKAPGIPVNKDTPATKLGKHEVSVTKSERGGLHRMSFFLYVSLVLGPVRPSPPSPAGDVVKYSSQLSDHIIPSHDVQGI